MRIGAVWARKGDYVGGSLSPTLSPSPYRTSRDEVCVQISFTDLGRDSIAGSLAEFITEQQRKELEMPYAIWPRAPRKHEQESEPTKNACRPHTMN